jgi:hypothetical protein
VGPAGAVRRPGRAHPGGIVDLSIGTPVDPTPAVVQEALRAAADAPGYPLTIGTPALREALVGWTGRRLGAEVTRAVVPVDRQQGAGLAAAVLPRASSPARRCSSRAGLPDLRRRRAARRLRPVPVEDPTRTTRPASAWSG